jgi:hypothetical protein
MRAGTIAMTERVEQSQSQHVVRHFRQILLWPLQLMPIREGSQIQKHWEVLRDSCEQWREVEDEIGGDPAQFQQRHYSEFITFLPQVQRFLYGEGRGAQPPIRVFRRRDVARVRMTFGAGEPVLVFEVAHIDLYFFYDIDVAVLAFEIWANDLPLDRVQDALFRFGRAYPAYWSADGSGRNCLPRVEWLDAAGAVLARSDYERRDKYLASVCRNRAAHIAAHWEYLLRPLVLHHSDEAGAIRYRLHEYHRMPVAAYLALDDPQALSRAQFVRLGLITAPGADTLPGADALPFAERHLWDFEQRYCYDRYWSGMPDGPATRYLCCGHGLVVVGRHGDAFFTDAETGVLGQFRHQHFLLFLVAHFHKAALLLFSDRLVVALNKLDISDAESVKHFKRAIRQVFEIFLRFTHRYWFHDIADQALARDLFRLTTGHLETDRLYTEVRDEIRDMSDYLDSDSQRRQANTVVRLTVVTTFGLIATVTTGFLGMNLLAEAEAPAATKLGYFAAVAVVTTVLTLFAVVKSKRLSDFLESMSDERLDWAGRIEPLRGLWRSRRRER